MPTYDYVCSACGEQVQVFHAMSATPPRTCAEARTLAGREPGACAGAVERLLTGGTGLIFKGSGFYITDYTKKGGAAESKGEKAEKSDGAKDAAAKASDAKKADAPAKAESPAAATSESAAPAQPKASESAT